MLVCCVFTDTYGYYSNLTIGKHYESKTHSKLSAYYILTGDNGIEGMYMKKYFTPVHELREKKLIRLGI